MKLETCPQEEAVARAARTGNWEASLTTHADACPICRGIMQTSSWMQVLAHSPERNLPLPDASLLWWSAQLSEKQANAERPHEVLDWMVLVSVVVPCLGLAAWLAWNSYAIPGWIAWWIVGMQSWMTTYTAPIYVLSVSGILGLIALILAYPILVDE
jgi:hypothetical protein